jgi:hypothetical protein
MFLQNQVKWPGLLPLEADFAPNIRSLHLTAAQLFDLVKILGLDGVIRPNYDLAHLDLQPPDNPQLLDNLPPCSSFSFS